MNINDYKSLHKWGDDGKKIMKYVVFFFIAACIKCRYLRLCPSFSTVLQTVRLRQYSERKKVGKGITSLIPLHQYGRYSINGLIGIHAQ